MKDWRKNLQHVKENLYQDGKGKYYLKGNDGRMRRAHLTVLTR